MKLKKRYLSIFDKPQNIFVAFLRLLEVKCTNLYSNQYYNNHPDKFNFFGISRMLSAYNIENLGVNFKDKKQAFFELEVPYIAHVGGELVLVCEKTEEEVIYLWNEKKVKISIENFIRAWSGATLIADVDSESIEPDYKYNKKKEQLLLFERFIIILSSIALFLYFYRKYNEIEWLVLLIANIIGLVASFFLLQKQLKVQGGFVDGVCSLLLTHSDCNSILDSKYSKLFSLISWSEIGFGYFLSNLIVMIFIPELLSMIFVLNIFALPYTFWSVGYQKIVVKQWCILCLIVQITLWIIFLINLFFRNFLSIYDWKEMFIVCNFYVIFIFMTNLILRYLSNLVRDKNLSNEFNSLAFNEDIFVFLLKKEHRYVAEMGCSNILLGNINAKNVITVITNPHCNPCSIMHKKIEKLLHDNCFCIQLIFTSFGKEFDDSCLGLIFLYYHNECIVYNNILSEWFNSGKLDRNAFWKKYPVDINQYPVIEEYSNHKKILSDLKLISTPNVFFNGYRLPSIYKVEDLSYFFNTNI